MLVSEGHDGLGGPRWSPRAAKPGDTAARQVKSMYIRMYTFAYALNKKNADVAHIHMNIFCSESNVINAEHL